MRCREVQQKLDLFATSELAPSERERVEAHLESCADCRQSLERLRQLENLLATSLAPPIPESFAARVFTRAKEQQLIAAHSESTARVLLRPAWKRLGVSAATAAALAAGLTLGVFMGHDTWQSGTRQKPTATTGSDDPLAASGFGQLVEPGGASLAQAYIGLTSD